MSGAASPQSGGRVRRGALALVMVGALSVSVGGQVAAVEPLLGGMSIVLALTNDLAALLALNEVTSTRRADVRRWAWAVLVLAGGTAAGLNTWHAVESGELPTPWAVVVGIGPVLLAVVLSHLVALVLSEGPAPAPQTHPQAGDAVAETPAPAAPAAVVERSGEATAIESSQAGQVRPDALTGPGVHHGLTVVPATRALPAPAADDDEPEQGERGSGPTDPRVEQLVDQLRAGAELTGGSVAEQLDCSPRTGRRLLRQAEEYMASTTREAGRTRRGAS